MFNIALQLEEPWKLAHIEFEGRDQAWHLYIDFERGTTFSCPFCGSACKEYDTEKKQWRHLDFWNWKTFMHARLPRVKCRSCNKVTQVPVKWARALSHLSNVKRIAIDETSSRPGHRYDIDVCGSRM
ncbi:transposase family protein [Paenibacillus sp. MER TA 81-3]|uniref:transposase family protein n=1 Tax=Paenibacillus sp. MER TA 81-3 TaxID=2939573 RepID=UPI0034D96A6C